MSAAFYEWKRQLESSAGAAQMASALLSMGDHILELFWRDGMEPTMSAFLDYAQAGLCKEYGIRADDAPEATAPR